MTNETKGAPAGASNDNRRQKKADNDFILRACNDYAALSRRYEEAVKVLAECERTLRERASPWGIALHQKVLTVLSGNPLPADAVRCTCADYGLTASTGQHETSCPCFGQPVHKPG